MKSSEDPFRSDQKAGTNGDRVSVIGASAMRPRNLIDKPDDGQA